MEGKQMQEAGKPEEQTFFEDPATDALLGVVMALAMEHYVLRDRVRVLEKELDRAGLVNPAALTDAPPAQSRASDQADAAAFVEDLLRPILGIQEAIGASGSFSLKKAR
jgi:hypothetical protein